MSRRKKKRIIQRSEEQNLETVQIEITAAVPPVPVEVSTAVSTTPSTPPIVSITNTTTSKNACATDRDGIAIYKIPKWAMKPNQYNHRIIRAYFQLLHENGRVTRIALEERCQNIQAHPEVFVKDFKGNFASMKTDKGNSHGKVFIEDGNNILIWENVVETLEKYRTHFATY